MGDLSLPHIPLAQFREKLLSTTNGSRQSSVTTFRAEVAVVLAFVPIGLEAAQARSRPESRRADDILLQLEIEGEGFDIGKLRTVLHGCSSEQISCLLSAAVQVRDKAERLEQAGVLYLMLEIIHLLQVRHLLQ